LQHAAATEPAATEGTQPMKLTGDGLRYINYPDPALAFCEAYGNLDEPNGVDQLLTRSCR
jgi:hypothetical protein